MVAQLAEQRAQVIDLLDENPSLRAELDETMPKAFRAGVSAAADEAALPKTLLQAGEVMSFEEAMSTPADWPESGAIL